MAKTFGVRVSNPMQMEDYYACKDIARSYLDFGVPKSLAEEWICTKLNVSKELSERACDYVYYHSKD